MSFLNSTLTLYFSKLSVSTTQYSKRVHEVHVPKNLKTQVINSFRFCQFPKIILLIKLLISSIKLSTYHKNYYGYEKFSFLIYFFNISLFYEPIKSNNKVTNILFIRIHLQKTLSKIYGTSTPVRICFK